MISNSHRAPDHGPVYFLFHAYEVFKNGIYTDFETFIGAFSSEAKCQEAIDSLLRLGYFATRPDDFQFGDHSIDKIEWTSGFVYKEEDRGGG